MSFLRKVARSLYLFFALVRNSSLISIPVYSKFKSRINSANLPVPAANSKTGPPAFFATELIKSLSPL